MTVGAPERFISMEQCLDDIVPDRHCTEGFQREANRRRADRDGSAGVDAFRIDAEDLLRVDTLADQKPRLAILGSREHQEDAPIDRCCPEPLRNRHLEPDGLGRCCSAQDLHGKKHPGKV
jgi:hypothetical protein